MDLYYILYLMSAIIGWELGRYTFFKLTHARYVDEEIKLTIKKEFESRNKKLLENYTRLKWYQWWKK